jgi:hypothetical protein
MPVPVRKKESVFQIIGRRIPKVAFGKNILSDTNIVFYMSVG